MDEDQFREAYRSANPAACAFEKAVLNQACQCPLSQRVCVADRQGVACTDALTRLTCERFLATLRERSRFALRLGRLPERLPHAQEIRVQLGGLRGARALLGEGASDDPVADVPALIQSLLARYGDLNAIPYQALVASVSAVDASRRGRRRPR